MITLNEEPMTTAEIQHEIVKRLNKSGITSVVLNFQGTGLHEADVLVLSNNDYLIEYEVKISHADFIADFKKVEKHRYLADRDAFNIYDEWKRGKKTGGTVKSIKIPNRFCYACEPGLISGCEVPEYAGLVYVYKDDPTRSIEVMKNAPLLHREKVTTTILKRMVAILAERLTCNGRSYAYDKILKSKEDKK